MNTGDFRNIAMMILVGTLIAFLVANSGAFTGFVNKFRAVWNWALRNTLGG